ncbi:MAG: hypothetical protein IJD13_07840 [Oscillospiraceae bacterium]|nr:hypothetical protein [Oscillospiraceae bacterium]
MLNLDFLIGKVRETIENHKLEEGVYARWLWQNEKGTRKMGPNEYGCADAANIRYMIGDMPDTEEERRACIKGLQSFQLPDSGLFFEGTHHELHCTAHCTAALELFDVKPALPMPGLDKFRTKEGLFDLLENLLWVDSPWNNAHQGAGIFAAMILTRSADLDWQNAYFDWLDEHCDPEYGMSLKGSIQTGVRPACEHLNGWFHYLFNYHFAHRAYPHAEKLIDTCLDLYAKGDEGLSPDFGKQANFREIDWVFALNRAAWQTGYRFAETREALRDFANKYIPYLETFDFDKNESWNDLHTLFGCVCCLAELQLALPGEIISSYPLRQVLDHRPFI